MHRQIQIQMQCRSRRRISVASPVSCFCNVFGLIIVRRQHGSHWLMQHSRTTCLGHGLLLLLLLRQTVGQYSACLHRLWVYVILMVGAAAAAAAVANDQWRLNWLPQLVAHSKCVQIAAAAAATAWPARRLLPAGSCSGWQQASSMAGSLFSAAINHAA